MGKIEFYARYMIPYITPDKFSPSVYQNSDSPQKFSENIYCSMETLIDDPSMTSDTSSVQCFVYIFSPRL